MRKIELLVPASSLEVLKIAVIFGADAVYIGAPKFGARAAAVNSLEDIEALVQHAHLYHARIYVTVNTILKEEDIEKYLGINTLAQLPLVKGTTKRTKKVKRARE